MASVDVEALYTLIPHEQGLNAVAHYHNTRGRQYLAHGRLVVDLLQYTLTHNYFLFGGKVYRQLNGTAMGSPSAPSYANLYLGHWETTTVFGDTPTEESDHVGLWARYIDDIFIIWQGSRDEFTAFADQLNVNTLGFKFYVRNL